MSASCSQRKCQNDSDSFCYKRGSYMTTKQRRPITDFVKKAYLAYFEVKLGDQDKNGLATKFVVHVWQLYANGQRDKNVI